MSSTCWPTNLNAMLDRIEALDERPARGFRQHRPRPQDAAVRACATRPRRRCARRGADAYRDGLEHTIENADELIKTFNALLLVARLEAGALEENAERFDVGRARARRGRALRAGRGGARAGARRRRGETGSQITAQPPARGARPSPISSTTPSSIRSRPRTPEREHRLRRSPSACESRGDAIEIAVADHGPGIAPRTASAC